MIKVSNTRIEIYTGIKPRHYQIITKVYSNSGNNYRIELYEVIGYCIKYVSTKYYTHLYELVNELNISFTEKLSIVGKL